jgi:molybdate transport repressor ModE-like protein
LLDLTASGDVPLSIQGSGFSDFSSPCLHGLTGAREIRMTKKNPKKIVKENLNINLLQTFYLVAKTGSFSSSARESRISYQSVANHVRRLEQMYGEPLVSTTKGSRNITLTPQGRALFTSLGSEFGSILSRVSMLMHDPQSLLRIGVTEAIFRNYFPQIIDDFRKTSPNVRLSFLERDTVLEQLMTSGELDVCVSDRMFGASQVVHKVLGEYRLCLIYPKSWGKPVRNEDPIEWCSTRPFITFEPGQSTRRRAIDYIEHKLGSVPEITLTASGSTSIVRLVEHGLGYSIVPEWCIAEKREEIARIFLPALTAIKLYFCFTEFLEGNDHIVALHKACMNWLGRP